MDQPPPKRRWQFSLKVLFVAITIAAAGMGMMHQGVALASGKHGYELYPEGETLATIGAMLISASPGVIIGYGFNRLQGAAIGGVASVGAMFLLYIILAIMLN